jgi:hypothetical protein
MRKCGKAGPLQVSLTSEKIVKKNNLYTFEKQEKLSVAGA